MSVTDWDKAVSARFDEVIRRRRLQKQVVAAIAQIHPSTLSRLLGCVVPWSDTNLKAVAAALSLNEQDLRELVPSPGVLRISNSNPKPVRIGETVIDEVHLLIGNHVDPIEIEPKYVHTFPQMPRDIAAVSGRLRERAAESNKKKTHFNGPCVRLVAAHESGDYQASDGREQKRVVVELAALTWEEHVVMNGFLDDTTVFPGAAVPTIRGRYGDPSQVYENGIAGPWCKLSNIFTVLMMPITTDGYGIVALRSKNITFAPGLFISGVSENMHRYQDEAIGPQFEKAVHALETPKDVVRSIDARYPPTRGVPSPLRTAMRGVYEEVAKEMGKILEAYPGRFVFLNLIWGFDHFHPFLVGVVRLPFDRVEAQKMYQESYGKDHSEARALYFQKLSMDDPDTSALVKAKEVWYLPGLSAFITSINFWREHGPG